MNLLGGTAPSTLEPLFSTTAAALLASSLAPTGQPQTTDPGLAGLPGLTAPDGTGLVLPQRQESAAACVLAQGLNPISPGGASAREASPVTQALALNARHDLPPCLNVGQDLTPLLKLLLDGELIGSLVEQLRNLPALPAVGPDAVCQGPVPHSLPLATVVSTPGDEPAFPATAVPVDRAIEMAVAESPGIHAQRGPQGHDEVDIPPQPEPCARGLRSDTTDAPAGSREPAAPSRDTAVRTPLTPRPDPSDPPARRNAAPTASGGMIALPAAQPDPTGDATAQPPLRGSTSTLAPVIASARSAPPASADAVASRLTREASAPEGPPMQGIDPSPSAARPVVFHNESAALSIAIPAARDLGLRDGQVIQALVASDANGLTIAVNGKPMRLPGPSTLRVGQQISLVVTSDSRGQVLKLQPERAGTGVPARSDPPDAPGASSLEAGAVAPRGGTTRDATRSGANPTISAPNESVKSVYPPAVARVSPDVDEKTAIAQPSAFASRTAHGEPHASLHNALQQAQPAVATPDPRALLSHLEPALALLLSPNGTPALAQLMAPGVLERVLGTLVAGTLARSLQAARPRPDAVTGPELRRIMRTSGLFTESMLSRGMSPAEGDLKVLLGRLVQAAPEQSEVHALAHQALSEVASAQVKAVQAQAEQQVLLSILVPFADGHPVRLTFSRSAPSRERSAPPFVVDVESMSGPLGEVSLRTTIQMPNRLDLTMWAARPDVAALARAHAGGLETELARAGLELASMAVHDGMRPRKPSGGSPAGSLFNLEA